MLLLMFYEEIINLIYLGPDYKSRTAAEAAIIIIDMPRFFYLYKKNYLKKVIVAYPIALI